jgi:hypothetical protein
MTIASLLAMEKKIAHLSVRMRPSLFRRLRAEAKRQKRTPSWLAHDILEEHFRRQHKKRSK